MDTMLKAPALCSNLELEQFKKLLCLRPEIDSRTIERRILKAHTLAFAYVESVLVGIGAVKFAKPGFRRRVLEGQKVRLLEELPDRELGWLYVKEDFRGRGIGSVLSSDLIGVLKNSQAYALTDSENPVTGKMLSSGGFFQCGEILLANHPSYFLYLKDSTP